MRRKSVGTIVANCCCVQFSPLINCFGARHATASFYFEIRDRKLHILRSQRLLASTALRNITSAVQPRKNDPRSAASASAWARSSPVPSCQRAVSMSPLRPPRPSLTDSRSPPARCISTGDPRRFTARVVSFSNMPIIFI